VHNVENKSRRIAKLIEVPAEGLKRVVLLNLDGEFGGGHRSATFLILRNCSLGESGFQASDGLA
jgi:hypothetical protein